MAETLVKLGIDVTMAARGSKILGTMEKEIDEIVEDELGRNGVTLLKSTQVREFKGENGYIRRAIFNNGRSMDVDIVIVATGVRPNSGIAKEAGIEIGYKDAIRVNQRMETSIPGIYSAGDCAETYHQILKRSVYLPLGTTSNKQGRIAGENMAGGHALFKGVVGTSTFKVFDLEVARTGLSSREAKSEGFDYISNVIEQYSRANYYPGGSKIRVKLIAEKNTGRILGAEMAGRDDVPKRIDVIATAITAKMTAEDIGNLDLSYAPPFAPVWDPVLIAANDLRKRINRAK